jgi:hypothetical protein
VTRAKLLALSTTLVLLTVALIAAVLVHRGREALLASDAALARGDVAHAIVFAERAAQARLPFSPYPEAGYARLFAIADQRATESDDATARDAYGAALRAARTTGDASGPHAAAAREGLARLDARAKIASAPRSDGPTLGPAPRVRFALAASVLLVAAAIAAVARGSRYAWAFFAIGLVTMLLSALE